MAINRLCESRPIVDRWKSNFGTCQTTSYYVSFDTLDNLRLQPQPVTTLAGTITCPDTFI